MIVLSEERANAITSRLRSSEYRFEYPTWHYLPPLEPHVPVASHKGEASLNKKRTHCRDVTTIVPLRTANFAVGREPICTLGHHTATTPIRTARRRATARDKRPAQSPAEQNRHRLQTSDLRIAMHRPRVPDWPEFQGQPKQETPGQRPDLGFTVEPPSGFEPETYALRVRCSGHLS